MFAAIQATEKVFREASLLDPYHDLFLVEANITAEAGCGDHGECSQHRHIKVELIVKEPGQVECSSLLAECEMSEKGGHWVPLSVEILEVSTNCRLSAVFHDNGVLEVDICNGSKIFA